MALWQWDIWIVPGKEIRKHFTVIPEFLDLDWFESVEWWNTLSENQLVSFFSGLLPDYHAPWAEHTRSWGSDEGDRIQLTVENGKITDVWIRIDLRNLNIELLNSLVTFSKINDLLFFTLDTQKFIEPELQILLENIRSSRKMLFVNDPGKFFEDKKYFDSINKEIKRKFDR